MFMASGQTEDAAAVVAEVERVLERPKSSALGAIVGTSTSSSTGTGIFIMVSGEAPELRMPSFEAVAKKQR